MNNDVVVKKSKIHGRGVFANRNFKKGEAVLRWDTSVTLTKSRVNKLSRSEKRYVSYLGKGKYILFQPPERYVNHSCSANNTRAKNNCDVAIKYIKKGEEITADYSLEGVPDLNMKCFCGSKNCRGVIQNKH